MHKHTPLFSAFFYTRGDFPPVYFCDSLFCLLYMIIICFTIYFWFFFSVFLADALTFSLQFTYAYFRLTFPEKYTAENNGVCFTVHAHTRTCT